MYVSQLSNENIFHILDRQLTYYVPHSLISQLERSNLGHIKIPLAEEYMDIEVQLEEKKA